MIYVFIYNIYDCAWNIPTVPVMYFTMYVLCHGPSIIHEVFMMYMTINNIVVTPIP